jgi:HEPN domain-containing protein
MIFRADEYYRAGGERMAQARSIFHSSGNYALATYCGGLAVECVLRAFRWKKDANFEGRHDLSELLRASGFLDLCDQLMRDKGVSQESIEIASARLLESMNQVMLLWHNNLRYACEKSFRAFLNRRNLLRGIKGDPLKKNASDLLNSAQNVVDQGVKLWDSDKR